MKRIPIIIVCTLFSLCVLLAIRNRPRPVVKSVFGPVTNINNGVEFYYFTNHPWPERPSRPHRPAGVHVEDNTVRTGTVVSQLINEGYSPEDALKLQNDITELARAHRATPGVFPGATTNRVLVEFEEDEP